MRRILLTFGNSNLRPALDRIAAQAAEIGGYDEVICADESHLSDEFRKTRARYLKPDVRGFGYWCWKPEIIFQTLKQASEGDIVHYIDAGCHLNANGRRRLDEYFEEAQDAPTGVLGFQSFAPCAAQPDPPPSFQWLDCDWCKGDLLDHLGARDADYLTTGTIMTGNAFFRRCDPATNLVHAWKDVPDHDMRLIDDRRSRTPNPPGFREHRHDQAIFSILCKQRGATCLSYSEIDVPEIDGMKDWTPLAEYPVHARRDIARTKWNRYAALRRHERLWHTVRNQVGLRLHQIRMTVASRVDQS